MAIILIVDDNPAVLDVYKITFQQQGHWVIEASSGAEAEVLFDKNDIDLVIIDYEMPSMKGDELSVRLKIKDPFCPIIP